jgi:hypothetical protein
MRKRLLALVFVVGALSAGAAAPAGAATAPAPSPASAVVNADSAIASGYATYGRYWS